MLAKEIYKYSEIEDKILSGLNKLVEPIVQTLTPKGRNVLYMNDVGQTFTTNDGFTIAKNITLEDSIENSVIEIVKHASFATNSVAGDGTTTTVLLSDSLIRNGLRVIGNGFNAMDLTRELNRVSQLLVSEIEKHKTKVVTDKDIEQLAMLSANNDYEIAKNVTRIVKKAGQDGLVFIEDSNRDKIEIIEEDGFVLEAGMFSQHFTNVRGKFAAQYENVLVFITDKRLYYEEEVMALLKAVAEQGENKVVVIAADFIGQAPNMFITNHLDEKINMNILLIKEEDSETIEDLASYLGGQVVSEKKGSLVDQLNQLAFVRANKIFSDPRRTVLFSERAKSSTLLKKRLEAIKARMKEVDADTPEEKKLKKRLACMTNGIVTVRVGGKTIPEIQERLFRYEDSINATRNALRDGYVVGGGLTLWRAYNALQSKLEAFTPEVRDIVKRYCQAPLIQIAKNCNIAPQTILEKVTDKVGYNAVTEQYEDLLKAGVIEPVLVLKSAVQNSFSVAQVLLSSGYMIINKKDESEK